jgi:small subunit ribosomal protein S8
MTNDTIADMLTRIRNANLAKHQIVQIPSTKVTKAIVKVLFDEGLIDSFEELENGLRGSLLISLKYVGVDRKPVIEKIQRNLMLVLKS